MDRRQTPQRDDVSCKMFFVVLDLLWVKLQHSNLLDILSLGDPLISYFDPWVTQGLDEVSRVQAHEVGDFVGIWKK